MGESAIKSYCTETKPVIQRLARNIHGGKNAEEGHSEFL